MVLNEFDAYREALKKINLNEEVMPIYKGRLLTENVEIYCKIQKILDCPAMEPCHRWLYDLDVENLDESECSKVNNLFQLGVDNGLLDDGSADADTQLSADAAAQDNAEMTMPVKDPAPVMPAPAPVPEAPMAAYTVVYSAMRDGQLKTGEAYSNSLNTRSAKADVISKLEKAGYQNISILAIEAGDPDMSGCDNTYCKQSDYVPPAYEDEEEKVDEADSREPLSHAFHPFGVNASTANTSGQDEVKLTLTEDEAREEVKKAFDEASKQVAEDPEVDEVKKFLNDNKDKLEELKTKLDEKGQKCFDTLYNALKKYADGQLSEDDSVAEAKGGKKPSTGVKTLVRGILKVFCTLISLSGSAVGLTGKIITWAGSILAAGADKVNASLKDSEQVDEAGEDDDSDGEGSSKDGEDSDDATDDGAKDGDSDAADSSEDSGEDSKAEDSKDEEAAEEPDEKLKDDKKEEEGKEDAKDDKEEKELTDQEKSQLRDSYKKAFKAAMQKCKFNGKCFDDLTLEEKVNFFTELDKAWGDKADPSKFMSDKETEALQKIVVKKQ